MSKGRKLTQQQKDHLKGLANRQQRWKEGKLFGSGWTYGVDGVKGSELGKETIEELLRKINEDTIKSEPKDERTESEKWADDWIQRHTGQRALSTKTNGTNA